MAKDNSKNRANNDIRGIIDNGDMTLNNGGLASIAQEAFDEQNKTKQNQGSASSESGTESGADSKKASSKSKSSSSESSSANNPLATDTDKNQSSQSDDSDSGTPDSDTGSGADTSDNSNDTGSDDKSGAEASSDSDSDSDSDEPSEQEERNRERHDKDINDGDVAGLDPATNQWSDAEEHSKHALQILNKAVDKNGDVDGNALKSAIQYLDQSNNQFYSGLRKMLKQQSDQLSEVRNRIHNFDQSKKDVDIFEHWMNHGILSTMQNDMAVISNVVSNPIFQEFARDMRKNGHDYDIPMNKGLKDQSEKAGQVVKETEQKRDSENGKSSGKDE